jgi:phage FluMu gp28-like protein
MSFEIGLHENQMKVYRSKARFIALNCGRRFGKSWFGATKIIVSALKKPGGVYWVCAPTFSQTDIMWRMVLKLLPKKYIKQIFLGKLCIELKNGATIWAKSTDKYDNLRGEGLDGVVMDEAAMMHPDAWFKVIRPALMDKLGWALFCTTPRGKNWYYKLYQKGVKGTIKYRDNWESFTFSSYDNPYLERDELAEIVEDLSELEYEQEILAIFLSDGGTVFKNLDACTRDYISADYQPGRIYTMGVDLGRHQDFTVIYVADTVTKEIVYGERFNRTAWSYVRSRIKSVFLKYGNPPVFLDTTGVGDAIQENLEGDGVTIVPYKFTLESKKQLVNRLSISFQNCDIFIPPDLVLREELESFTYVQTEAGNIKYAAPKGYFDDCVCALMLTNYGMNGGVALCLGGFEMELTQEQYEKRLKKPDGVKIELKEEDYERDIYDWYSDDNSDIDYSRYDDDLYPDEEAYEEDMMYVKRGKVSYIEV